MRGASALGVLLVFSASLSIAVASEPRPWQQRLQIEIPLPVPAVELERVNPFALSIDTMPRLLTSAAPRKVPVAGPAVIAAYVDAKGECLGAVPLELPFPGLTSVIVDELTGSRFEPAKVGGDSVPSWVVLEVVLHGKVKEGVAGKPQLDLPNPTRPPVPNTPSTVSPSSNLLRLPATPAAELTALAQPRRLKIKAPGQEADIPIEVLVHITETGMCDRFVSLDLPAGLDPWVSAFLSTWRLEPATLDGTPAAAWLIYTGRVQLKLSALQSADVRTLADRTYDPHGDTSSE
jgi:hypothetical protein